MNNAIQPQDWEVRAAAYRHLIDTFTAPATEDLARRLDMPAAEIAASLERLAAGHQIVLAPGETRIWMLHPFSATPTEFPVEVEGGTYWANCAWDAFGIPAVLGGDSRTQTRCAESGVAIEFGVRDGAVMDLELTWQLAQVWYAGRAGAEWRGRSAEQSQAIVRSVGLEGEFWMF